MKIFNKKQNDNEENQGTELGPMVPLELKGKGTPIEKLPNEILEYVLSFLDRNSLVKAMRVKFFNQAAKNNQLWKRHVSELLTKEPQLNKDESYYAFLLRFKNELEQLNIILKNKQELSVQKTLSYLYKIAENGFEKIFFTIIQTFPTIKEKLKAYRNDEDFNGTLVHAAVESNSVEILNQLLELGAGLQIRRDKYVAYGETGVWVKDAGISPLDLAALKGSYECMKTLLLEIKKSKNSDIFGESLHYAAKNGHLNCVKLLVENGSPLDGKNDDKKIPYELAKDNNHEECISYLAEAMQKKNIAIPKEEKICNLQ